MSLNLRHNPTERSKQLTVANVPKISMINFFVSMFGVSHNKVRSRRTVKPAWLEPHYGTQAKTTTLTITNVEKNQKIDEHHSCKEEPAPKSCVKYIEEYFSNATLHGLHYVGDTTISFGERLFWLVAFIVAVSSAAYFISSIYSKYDLSPIIISLNPKPTSISGLPFPAVTICSMNQAKKYEALDILDSGTEVEKLLLYDYCNSNNSFSNNTAKNDEAGKWENVQKFILRVSPSCKEMLKVCLWRQEEIPCNFLFNTSITDDGLCCTFNALPETEIFKNPREMAGLNFSSPIDVTNWNPETGYSPNASVHSVPRRASGPGAHLGLSVVLDSQLKLYYCSSSTGVGFKILLHNPLETPKMADFAFLAAPGLETRVVIQPRINDASKSISGIDIKKRMCYFSQERYLQFYKSYTELSCKLECQTNHTLAKCGCVPYYLPKNRFKKICSKKEEPCIYAARGMTLLNSPRAVIVDLTKALELVNEKGSTCNCLPGCFELAFEASSTFGKLVNFFEIKKVLKQNESLDYFKENMAILHFFFTESQFISNTKTELYGFSEFLSNTGGLLGLFLGFSALSVVEIIYYLTLRACCRSVRSRKNIKRTTKKKNIVQNKNSNLYPFIH